MHYQQIVLDQLYILTEEEKQTKIGPLSHTTHKNQLKIDQRPKQRANAIKLLGKKNDLHNLE